MSARFSDRRERHSYQPYGRNFNDRHNVNDRNRGRLTRREFVQKYPVHEVTQRQDPGILLP